MKRLPPGRSLLLIALLLLALALRVGVALHRPSLTHPDEVFQTLEPAHRLAFGNGVVTWGVERWRPVVGISRHALLAGIMRATSWMGGGSFGYLSAITVFLSLLSLTTVWFAYAWGKRASGINAAIIGAGAAAIWWQLIFFAPRALNEVVAGNVLLVGLYLGAYESNRLSEARRLLLAGLCCGLALALRVQLAPAVVFACFWFCRPSWRKRMPAVALGALLPIVVFGLVDGFTWSYPFQSFVRYVWVNVAEGRSLRYGTEPWYWYFWIIIQYFGVLVLFALAGVRRSPLLGWMALVIVATHSILAHKEIRFIYPAVPILITLAALGLADAAEFISANRTIRLGSTTIVAGCLALCAITSGMYAWGYPGWTAAGGLIAFDRLSRDSTVCGVGVYAEDWPGTGGYAHLHRNIPIVIVPDRAIEHETPSFNALIADRTVHVDRQSGFTLVQSWNDVALYRRGGGCAAPGDEEINAVLRRGGY